MTSETAHSHPEDFFTVKGRFHEKKLAVLLDLVQMRGGGGGPAQIFCHLFMSAFLVKKFISSKMPIIRTLNCFLGTIHDPQSKYSAFI